MRSIFFAITVLKPLDSFILENHAERPGGKSLGQSDVERKTQQRPSACSAAKSAYESARSGSETARRELFQAVAEADRVVS